MSGSIPKYLNSQMSLNGQIRISEISIVGYIIYFL